MYWYYVTQALFIEIHFMNNKMTQKKSYYLALLLNIGDILIPTAVSHAHVCAGHYMQ